MTLSLCRAPALTEWSRERWSAWICPRELPLSLRPPCPTAPASLLVLRLSGFVGVPGEALGWQLGAGRSAAGRRTPRPASSAAGRAAGARRLISGPYLGRGPPRRLGCQVCRSRSQAHPSFIPEWAGGRRCRRLPGLCGKSQLDARAVVCPAHREDRDRAASRSPLR